MRHHQHDDWHCDFCEQLAEEHANPPLHDLDERLCEYGETL